MRSWTFVALLLIATSAAAQAPPAKTKPAGKTPPMVQAVEPEKEASFMFVQTAEKGSFAPLDGADKTRYKLTLSSVGPETIYFSDRPQRIAGGLENGRFLRSFPFSPANPPNAAVVLSTPKSRDEDVIVVELTKPNYDAKARTLSYEVKVLTNTEGGLAFYADKLDARLPAAFEQVSVFIDDCPNTTAECYGSYQCSGGGEDQQCCRVDCGSLGYSVGTCWQWFPPGCYVCNDYSAACNSGPCSGGNIYCLVNQCGTSALCQ